MNLEDIPEYLDYKVIDGVTIFSGTSKLSKSIDKSSIKFHKKELKKQGFEGLFTDLQSSTFTTKGYISNIQFVEKEVIDFMSIPKSSYIIKIGCNFGEIFNPDETYKPPPKPEKKSNRGRKPKVKIKSKRKVQGNGRYFSSQITFEVYNPTNERIYKIKLFRNGKFQVPGVSNKDISDLIHPINTMVEYLREEFMDPDIKPVYFISVMRNYKCKFANPDLFVYIKKLELKLMEEKIRTIDPDDIVETLNNNSSMPIELCGEIVSYMNNCQNVMKIAEIQNNPERYGGLIIKFYRPIPWHEEKAKKEKRTTIKILRSGKINFDGGISENQVRVLYYWLQWFIIKHYEDVLYDAEETEEFSSDTSGYESVYDSE